MAYYPKNEQETIYRYDPKEDEWYVWTCVPKHIREIRKKGAEVMATDRDDDGRIIALSARLGPNRISLRNPRAALTEREQAARDKGLEAMRARKQ